MSEFFTAALAVISVETTFCTTAILRNKDKLCSAFGKSIPFEEKEGSFRNSSAKWRSG